MKPTKTERRKLATSALNSLARYLDALKPDIEKFVADHGADITVARREWIEDARRAIVKLSEKEG